jgi:DDE domain
MRGAGTDSLDPSVVPGAPTRRTFPFKANGITSRAVDKQGKTVDFLLRRDRGIATAQAFFRKALATNINRWPRKVTLDGHVPSHRALRLLRREDPRWRNVEVRSCKYLNNIIEQDHRAIKRRCASMTGFKSFDNAAITIAGIELAHRINKRQFSFGAPRAVVEGAMGSGTRLRLSIAETRFQSSCVAALAPEPRRATPRAYDPRNPIARSFAA